MADRPDRPGEPEREIARIRRRIDTLDRRIVALLSERARLGREIGRAKRDAGRRDVRDAEREREVLLRVAMANDGPLPQADLLAIYGRIVEATRALEMEDGAPPEPDGGGARANVGSPPAGEPGAG